MRRLALALAGALVAAEVVLSVFILRDIGYVTTHRLFISQRIDDPAHSGATQRFDIEGARVVPQIATRDADRITFRTAIGYPSVLRVGIRVTGRAGCAVHSRSAA